MLRAPGTARWVNIGLDRLRAPGMARWVNIGLDRLDRPQAANLYGGLHWNYNNLDKDYLLVVGQMSAVH